MLRPFQVEALRKLVETAPLQVGPMTDAALDLARSRVERARILPTASRKLDVRTDGRKNEARSRIAEALRSVEVSGLVSLVLTEAVVTGVEDRAILALHFITPDHRSGFATGVRVEAVCEDGLEADPKHLFRLILREFFFSQSE